MLFDQQLELSLELCLLGIVWEDGIYCAICQRFCLQRSESRHVLDDHQAHLIASLIVQVHLNFDLKKHSAHNRN